MDVKVLILTGDGVNCENETGHAFKMAGADPSIFHINELEKNPDLINNFDIMALPGGFSFGDELGSGKVFSLKLEKYLGDRLHKFIANKKPIIGICNGFQILTKLGLLNPDWDQFGLARNNSGNFIDKWVDINVTSAQQGTSIWLKGIEELRLPIRHGEGRFITMASVEKLITNGHSLLTYSGDNPNGSTHAIAGISDASGLVFGLMPHPEAAVKEELYPGGNWSGTLGIKLFENAVNYVKDNLHE